MEKVYERQLKKLNELDYKMRMLGETYRLASYERTAVAPMNSADSRGKILAYLQGEIYNLSTSNQMKEVVDCLSECEQKLDIKTRGVLRHFRRNYQKLKSISPKLNEEYTLAIIASEAQWQISKSEGNYETMKPYLSRVIDCTKQMIEAWDWEDHPYNALLKYNDPGMTVKKINSLFCQMKDCIIPLTKQIFKNGAFIDDSFAFKKIYSKEKQILFCNHLLDVMGFDKSRGVALESEHPYTEAINSQDVRITNHYHENKLFSGIFSTLHEGGHGLYEQGVSIKLIDSVIGEGMPCSIHESSSRFWENIVGRNRSLWQREIPYLKMIFPKQLEGISPDDMYRAVNKVFNTPLRLHADEVTYNLHIMFRYEIEKDIFGGKLTVDDLPQVWAEKTKAYLGIEPQNHAEGILQDVHWPSGLFGYFQGYALGNIINAQLAHTMKKDLPNFDEIILNGKCDVILNWLTKKWYKYGCAIEPLELLESINGEELNASYFCDYIQKKYAEIYKL